MFLRLTAKNNFLGDVATHFAVNFAKAQSRWLGAGPCRLAAGFCVGSEQDSPLVSASDHCSSPAGRRASVQVERLK